MANAAHLDGVDSPVCGGTAAFVFMDDRVYVFTIWITGGEPWPEAFLSTVQFQSATPAASTTPTTELRMV